MGRLCGIAPKSVSAVFHLHEVNPLINCVFVINENHEVFFTLQLKIITKYIIEDLKEGKMIYVNMEGDNTEIKDCFYLENADWCRYENEIVAMINPNFIDFSEGFPIIVRRIDLEGDYSGLFEPTGVPHRNIQEGK